MFDLTAVEISLKTATVATIITFFLGVAAARWMWGHQSKYKVLIEVVLTAPLVLPPTVVGFFLLLILGRNSFIGQLLELVNIRIVFSWYATVIAAVVVSFPLMYKTALGAFTQIDRDLIACSRTLGASEWTILVRLLLPLAKPGLIAGTLLSFARALGEFGATLMLAGSIPGKTETIPIAIYLAAESGATNRALLLVSIILLISLVITASANYWEHRDIRINRKQKVSLSRGSKQDNSKIITNDGINLIVNIQKQLSDFVLDVNFTTDSNPLGILGASGAGKSTIVRCIAGLETPDRGIISLNGKVLFDSQKKINLAIKERGCGILFRDYALFPHLTVGENIAFGMSNKLSSNQIKQEVEKQLIMVELQGISDRYIHNLSGGQQQRVALARVKASNPEILLLDEPFSALDTYLRHKQEKLLRKSLQTYRGVTLLITHNLEEAYRVCPNLLIIDRGKAIAYGNKENIFQHSPNMRTARVTNCKNFSQGIIINQRQVKAIDWNCLLEVTEITSKNLTNTAITIGIRAHQIILTESDEGVNIFDCWLTSYSETQHQVTCYLKLHQPPNNAEDYHLQTEVLQDKWLQLQKKSFPWKIQLHPSRIMIFGS